MCDASKHKNIQPGFGEPHGLREETCAISGMLHPDLLWKHIVYQLFLLQLFDYIHFCNKKIKE